MTFKQAVDVFMMLMRVPITLNGFTFSVGSIMIFLGILGLIVILIGGLLR